MADPDIFYTWRPIEDLPQNWESMRASELAELAAIWITQNDKLKTSDGIRQFNDRLSREWAIETGIIENIYSIDAGTTQVLIEKGIEASLMPFKSTDISPGRIVKIVRDHQDALEGLFSFVTQQRDLTTSYIRQLHQVLTRHQDIVETVDAQGNPFNIDLPHGDWKKWPNSPTRSDGRIHEYCPPQEVQNEMDRLVSMHLDHVKKGVTPEFEAAWLHHRFTQIHPFQDGNGRVARSLASLVFLKSNWFPLVINREQFADYVSALEIADQGNLAPLVLMFCDIQENLFAEALCLAN